MKKRMLLIQLLLSNSHCLRCLLAREGTEEACDYYSFNKIHLKQKCLLQKPTLWAVPELVEGRCLSLSMASAFDKLRHRVSVNNN
jgi:hypothetical protein